MSRAAWMTCALLIASGCAHDARAPGVNERAPAHQLAPEALARRGRELLQHGDYLRAEQYLQLALRAGHAERPLIVPLLTTCIASGRLRAALMHADRHLARHPRAWQARFIKAALLQALGEARRAQLERESALADAPADARRQLANGGAP